MVGIAAAADNAQVEQRGELGVQVGRFGDVAAVEFGRLVELGVTET